MNIPWFHNKRQEILDQPFPAEWRPWLESSVTHYRLLTPTEKTRLEGDLRVFMTEKDWEGGSGLDVTDEMKVVISGNACLLTLGFEKHDYFPNVQSIIVYASGYRARPASRLGGSVLGVGGIVESSLESRLGEAHANGPIIISWSDSKAGGGNEVDGENVVLHEFAHKLDFRNGAADGVPRLETSEQYDQWSEAMSAEYEQLVDDVAHHRHTLLREYGATNPAEFFAVATETFFEKPVKMREGHSDLYQALNGFYRIDWAERVDSARLQ